MSRPLTDLDIAVRVVPTVLRWPDANKGVWRTLRDCVQSLHALGRRLDERCMEVERDTALDRKSIERQRNELGSAALLELSSFKPFQIADKAASEEINLLEQQPYRTAQEVQAYNALIKARADLREGIPATRRLVLERCKMRERAAVGSF